MAAIRPKSIHDQIVDTLGRQIVSGEFPAHSQIPTEMVLAESLGIGRLAVREAMKALAARGLVVIRPKTGTQVLPREHWNLFDPQILNWLTQKPLGGKFLDDLIELRRAIEPTAARLAAARREPEDLARMRGDFQAMQAARTREDYIAADLAFHGALLRASGNQFIRQLEGALSGVLRASFTASRGAHVADSKALQLHESLLLACEAGDAAAAQAAVERLIDRAVTNIQASGKRRG